MGFLVLMLVNLRVQNLRADVLILVVMLNRLFTVITLFNLYHQNVCQTGNLRVRMNGYKSDLLTCVIEGINFKFVRSFASISVFGKERKTS